jgi:pentatricopeptide repeat protein
MRHTASRANPLNQPAHAVLYRGPQRRAEHQARPSGNFHRKILGGAQKPAQLNRNERRSKRRKYMSTCIQSGQNPENLSTIHSMLNLGDFQRDLHHDEDAEKSFHRVLDVTGHVLGPDQPEAAAANYDLATVLVHEGRVEEALSLLRQAVDHGVPPRIASDMGNDPMLNSLHGDLRFAELVTYGKKRATGPNAK